MVEVAVYILVFIAMSGIMAMVDAAVLSVSRAEVEEMVGRKLAGSVALKTVVERLPRAVVVIVLLTNTINILGPILAGQKAVDVYGDKAIGVLTAILTFGTILFSEIIPKSIGAHYAPRIGRVAAPIILVLVYVLYPVVIVLAWVSRLFQSGERRIGTESQIRSLTQLGRRAGYIEDDESQLIHRAFILNDKTAADLMTPLRDVVSIDHSTSNEQAIEIVRSNIFSRYPVFGQSINQVEGMVLSRDVLSATYDEKNGWGLASVIRPVLTVDESTHSDDLLRRFRKAKIHLAVVQQAGKTIGVVSLEDVLEQLVGEIEDERSS